MSLPNDGLKAAADTAKQIIALSTGVLTVTMTFIEKWGAQAGRIPLAVGWAAFLASILAGVWTLMQITTALTTLDRQSHRAASLPTPPPGAPPLRQTVPLIDAFHPKIRRWAIVMVLSFFLGLASILVASFLAFFAPPSGAVSTVSITWAPSSSATAP